MDNVVTQRSYPVGPAQRISWGAVFGGAVLSVGIWILLEILGFAIGLSAMDPNQGSFRAIGIGTGIWTLVAPLIALFIGGIVAGRLAGFVDRLGGALHGGVMWALTMIIGVFLIGSVGRTLVSGVTGVAGTAVRGVSGMGSASLDALGLNANDLVGPVNQKLRAQGKPEVTASQLQAATRDALATSVREGRLDRDTLTGSLAQHTKMSQEDASQVAGQIESRWNAEAGELRAKALAAADQTGKALFWAFGALLLGLISSLLGATVGVSRRQREVIERPAVATVTEPTPAPVPPPERRF